MDKILKHSIVYDNASTIIRTILLVNEELRKEMIQKVSLIFQRLMEVHLKLLEESQVLLHLKRIKRRKRRKLHLNLLQESQDNQTPNLNFQKKKSKKKLNLKKTEKWYECNKKRKESIQLPIFGVKSNTSSLKFYSHKEDIKKLRKIWLWVKLSVKLSTINIS